MHIHLNIVKAIDPQNLFNNIGFLFNINAIWWDHKFEINPISMNYFNIQKVKNFLYSLSFNLFTNKPVDVVKVNIDLNIFYLLWINICNIWWYLSACNLFYKHYSPLKSPFGDIWISTSFKPECCISFQSVSLWSLADRNRIKVCTFEEDIFCWGCNTRFNPTEYSCNTHSFLCITNHKIAWWETSFSIVQSNELAFIRQIFDNDFFTLNLISIKCV